MNYVINTALVIFIIGWTLLGLWMLVKYAVLFGPHPDDPAESPGARSFGVAHILMVWIGALALAVYFLFR